MTTITPNTSYINNMDLYGSFNERRTRYAQKRKNSYLETIKEHKTGFTIAGIVALLFGGAGLFISKDIRKNKNYQAVFDSIQNKLKELSDKTSGGTEKIKSGTAKVKKMFYNVAMAFYNQNIYTNVWQLKLAEKCGWAGRQVIALSKASIKGPQKVAKINYENLAKNAVKLSKKITSFSLTGLTAKEQEMVKKLQQITEEKEFTKVIQKVNDEFSNRITKMRQTIIKNDVNPHIEKYYPKSLTKAEIVRHFKENANGFFNKEILRENWENTTETLFKEIKQTGTGKNTIGQTMNELEAIYNEIDNVGNPSKALVGLKKGIKSFINDYKNATDFEVNRYGGRELDLQAGGGLSEIAMPPVLGLILTHALMKKTDPNEKKQSFGDKFVEKNGVAFVGGLLTWGLVSGVFGVNGTPAYLSGLASGFVLDKGFKEVYNRLRKKE